MQVIRQLNIRFTLFLSLILSQNAWADTFNLDSRAAGGSSTFSVNLEEAAGSPVVGAVLMHGRGSYNRGPVVSQIQDSLVKNGYTTLSIDNPIPKSGSTEFSEYRNDILNNDNYVFPETYARVRTAINYLAGLGVDRVVLVGFSLGSRLTAAHVANGQDNDQSIIGLIGVGMYATSNVDPLDPIYTLPDVVVPFLDIYGDNDTNAVETRQLRADKYSSRGIDHRQVELTCSLTLSTNDCHKLVGLKGGEDSPLEQTVNAWMKCWAPQTKGQVDCSDSDSLSSATRSDNALANASINLSMILLCLIMLIGLRLKFTQTK